MSRPERIAAQLKEWAVEAGFDRAGIAHLEPSRQAAPFRRWIERGEHAGMEWLARRIEIRMDPAQLLPGARSVLCVALQYHPLEGQEPAAGDLWPKVARYAHGRDYHDVMGKRLKALATRIRDAYPGCGTRPYVDTGPLLERELAARAGLGAQGKNTLLLHRDWGSWFLLGEVLLTLELAADEPIGDLCGHCSRCLDACPTGALVEPYRLDSNRCISYWTIEHRGDLPVAAREMVGEWVFGCDVCQEVCPYNDRPRSGTPRPVDHPELCLPPVRGELDLAGLLELDQEEYVERFQVSPIKRTKLAGLQRNAAVAMAHRGDAEYVPALVRALAATSSTLRRHAAWALGRLAASEAGLVSSEARSALRRAERIEGDAEVREEIAAALLASAESGRSGSLGAAETLTENC